MALIIGGYLSSTIAMAFGGQATRRRRLGIARDRRRDRSAPHGHARRARARRHSHVQVPRALGPLHARDDGRRVRDRRPADVLGAGGTLVVVIVFVIFGAPASGGTVPAAYLPGSLADVRPVPAGRRRHDRRAEHDLLRRQPHRDVADHPRRLSRRRSARRAPPPSAARAEQHGSRGRGVHRGYRGRLVTSYARISTYPSVPCTRIRCPSRISRVACSTPDDGRQAVLPCDHRAVGHQAAHLRHQARDRDEQRRPAGVRVGGDQDVARLRDRPPPCPG